ncbi:TRL-like family protein [Leptospira sp. 96542]|nr:TRL-like family protein [Leptospira sp. 96542]
MKFCSFLFLFLLSCASPGFGPKGFIYTNTKTGIFGTGVSGSLKSESCVHSILGLVSFGNASLDTLKSQSNIKQITETNWKTFGILGIYANLCIEVLGMP